jgi:hypothetical protein
MFESILAVIILVCLIAIGALLRQQRNAARTKATLQANIQALDQIIDRERLEKLAAIEKLKTELASLDKFRPILDAEAKARDIIAAAKRFEESSQAINEDKTRRAGEDAARIVADAMVKASQIIQQANKDEAALQATITADRAAANQDAKAKKAEADARVAAAAAEAARIVEAARQRAQEIAGDALEAKDKAAIYEKAVRAMKNIIDGYDDRYILPSYSLLDELADAFGHTEAGQALKNAREHTARLVRISHAAACDYVEANRKETAVRFVVDAFNGKVDSILSRSKADNYGTLKQQILDAYNLVNFNGEAFRNARISQEYLEARLAELKWAVLAQELKDQEREEQRRIREQIREEERAQKEFEKALRDAAKEEATLQKAMDKVRAELDYANAEEKLKYEAQLAELEEKLHQAEEKNQRALSMAQQTKAGHVYIISNMGSFGEEVFKIGMTRRLEPTDRIRELGDASVPFPFDIHAMIYNDDAPSLEHALHKHFMRTQMNKVNPRKEFFRVSLAGVRQEIEALGITAHWTMAAEAREYRESLVIEQQLKDDPQAGSAWLEHQLDIIPTLDTEPETTE